MLLNTKESGVTIVELLMTVAIGGVVVVASYQGIQMVNDNRWALESSAAVIQDMEVFSKVIRKELPGLISEMDPETDPMTVTYPALNARLWDCPAGGPCLFNAIVNGNGIGLLMVCQSGGPATVMKAKYSTENSGSNCSSCPDGQLPTFGLSRMRNYTWMTDKVYFAPDYGNKAVAKNNLGIIGMQFCFRAPGYQENLGSSAYPNIVTKYDHWEITLIPYYFSQRPQSSWSDSQVSQVLKSAPEKIMVGPLDQLGPDIKILP